jgi:hypothetical protein
MDLQRTPCLVVALLLTISSVLLLLMWTFILMVDYQSVCNRVVSVMCCMWYSDEWATEWSTELVVSSWHWLNSYSDTRYQVNMATRGTRHTSVQIIIKRATKMDDCVILKHKSRLQARIGATICWLMFIHEQSKIEAYGAARNESMKMHVKATNCIRKFWYANFLSVEKIYVAAVIRGPARKMRLAQTILRSLL